MLDVEILDDVESLRPLRDEWDAFVESIGGEIYQTVDWLRVWWKYYGNAHKVFIFLFRSQGRLVGVLPLYGETIWLGPVFIRAVKIIGCDHTIGDSFYPTIDEQYWKEAYAFVFQKLLSRRRWDVHVLGPLAGIFHTKVGLLKGCIEEAGAGSIGVKELMYADQTYFFVNGDFDGYIKSLDKKSRHELRRKQTLFEEAAGKDRALDSRLASPDEVPEMFETFYRSHQSHWNRKNIPGSFNAWPKSKQFHAEAARAIASRGRLRLLEVRLGSEPVGHKYAYRCGKRLVEYLDARLDDPVLERASLGSVVFLEQVKRACGEGVEVIDSLHGRYEHKKRMGGRLLPAKVLIAYRRQAALRLYVFQRLVNVLDVLYYKVWIRRACPRLGVRRGPLWQCWIRTRGLAGPVQGGIDGSPQRRSADKTTGEGDG